MISIITSHYIHLKGGSGGGESDQKEKDKGRNERQSNITKTDEEQLQRFFKKRERENF